MRWLSIVLALSGLHCKAAVDLEFPTSNQSKAVVNAEYSPDSMWTVLLHRSIPYRDSVRWGDQVISDAAVMIRGGDGSAERLLHTGDGVFRSPAGPHPQSDVPYELTVSAEGLPLATAASSAPAIHATFLAIQKLASPSDSSKGSYQVRSEVHDRPGTDRYSIRVDQLEPVCRDEHGYVRADDTGHGATEYRAVELDTPFREVRAWVSEVNDPSQPSVPEDNLYGWGYFSDRLFEGATKDIELTIVAVHFGGFAPHFRIVVSNWSQERWSYEESFELVDPFYPDFFGFGPSMLYTNVTGGLGVFGGVSNEAFRVDGKGTAWEEDDLRVGLGYLQPCDR